MSIYDIQHSRHPCHCPRHQGALAELYYMCTLCGKSTWQCRCPRAISQERFEYMCRSRWLAIRKARSTKEE